MTQVLDNIRVLDLSRVLAGPWASQILGDLGADVVKVERTGRGDDARSYPPFAKDGAGADTCESAFFLAVNRNKRSVAADFTTPEGRAFVRALATQCDVLIENYKVGDLARHGLDYAALRALNPRLIYCSLTGYGQTGPYAPRPGYDSVFQAQSGLMSVTGQPDGAPGGGPVRVGVGIADMVAGYNVAIAVLGALHRRDTHGEDGQHIDIALLDCAVAAMSHVNTAYFLSGQVPQRWGAESNAGMPATVVACADRAIFVSVGNNDQFARLCRLIGRAELAADPRFASNALRWQHRAALMPTVAAIFQTWYARELVDALSRAGVPAGVVNSVADVFEDPQVQARGVRFALPHAQLGQVDMVANPIRYSATPVRYRRAPPLLGEHTQAVRDDWLAGARPGPGAP
ncbi:CaiB/BaiF CoA transferase family protein [Pseudorhodoferax sp.]|uniref:CaiB/BaiF CoA transferase family protein n=1 Tax=Pseudorhodoferax sp. TaxID=1993553 RepID=UPI002DD6562A|nr:CoA transferase [Pseudorhodoferax sp.]